MAKSKREDRILFHVEETTEENNTTQEFEAIGKDNEELTTELNNDVQSEENVLGEVNVDVTKRPKVTAIDPSFYRSDSKLSKKLKAIEWEDKDGDDVKEKFMEVDKTETASENEYKAYQQMAAINLRSYGGNTRGISYPYELHWTGPKTYGTFNPTTKVFTPNANG